MHPICIPLIRWPSDQAPQKYSIPIYSFAILIKEARECRVLISLPRKGNTTMACKQIPWVFGRG